MILDLSDQLGWDSEVNDFSALGAYLANQQFSIHLETLLQHVSIGLGFGSICQRMDNSFKNQHLVFQPYLA